jgi:transposase
MEIKSGLEELQPLRKYRATLVPPEVRVFVAKVAPALKEEGVSYKRQREIYSEAGYEISGASFRRHRASMHDGEAPLSADKQAGRPRALTEREIMIFVGWLLTQNDEHELVGIRECVGFIKGHLGHELSTGTVHKYLMASGFSSHVGRRRSAGYKLNFNSLVDLYVADVRRFWDLGIKHMPPQHVACIDSSSNGWRLLTRRPYSLKGGKRPKIKKGNPAYTNLVVWAVFPDGVNRCPALLFTGDPQFGERSRKKEKLDNLLEKYEISPSRIVFCPDRQYVGESQATIQAFLKHYSGLKGCLLLSGAGKSYSKQGIDIVRDWGARHETFTPATHEYLSPLDNHAFGIAKAKLRSTKVDESDRLEPSLFFLNALDSIPPETIQAMW